MPKADERKLDRDKAPSRESTPNAESRTELSEAQIDALVADAKEFKHRHDKAFRILSGRE